MSRHTATPRVCHAAGRTALCRHSSATHAERFHVSSESTGIIGNITGEPLAGQPLPVVRSSPRTRRSRQSCDAPGLDVKRNRRFPADRTHRFRAGKGWSAGCPPTGSRDGDRAPRNPRGARERHRMPLSRSSRGLGAMGWGSHTTDLVEAVPALPVDQLTPAEGSHSCPKTLLAGPLDLAVAPRVVHTFATLSYLFSIPCGPQLGRPVEPGIVPPRQPNATRRGSHLRPPISSR